MPFGYFGAKHGLAKFYPAPTHNTIIEPFAGSAAYSCKWATPDTHVILRDINPDVIGLWYRLQGMSVDELMAIPMPVKGERTVEPLIAAASGEQGMAVLAGKSRQITDRMAKSWPRLRQRIATALPMIKNWDVQLGDYSSIKNTKATWFVDPPYTSKAGSRSDDGSRTKVTEGTKGAGGDRYSEHGVGFNSHDDLAKWCLSRKGQLIVCEQMPADWLPFQPFRTQRNGVGAGIQSTRTEAMYARIK